MPLVTGIVAAGVAALAGLALVQATPERGSRLVLGEAAAPEAASAPPVRTAAPAATAIRHGWWTVEPLPPPSRALPLVLPLALPAGTTGVRLSAIPDRYLNDQPAARFRVLVSVRGTPGLAAIDGPAVIAWSEAGFWYELASARFTVAQLIQLASALE